MSRGACWLVSSLTGIAQTRHRVSRAHVVSAILVIGLGTGTAGASRTPLPWAVIAETLSVDKPHHRARRPQNTEIPTASSRIIPARDSGPSWAFKPRERIAFQRPNVGAVYQSLRGGKAELSKWQGSSWKRVDSVATVKEGRRVWLKTGIGEAGFFKIGFPLTTAPSGVTTHVIVCEDWKRDLLAFCRQSKQHIELNRDPELIRASTAVSHWDHVMELISEAPILSGEILVALWHAVESERDFKAGRLPRFVAGLNRLRLKPFEGAPIEEFVLLLPVGYDGSEPWPLMVYPDNRRLAPAQHYRVRSGYMDLWWHTVADKDTDWKTYQTFMTLLRERVNIDMERIYVHGDCGNALAAMSLVLNHPDYWAECSASLASAYRPMAANALNVPLIFVKGAHREPEMAAYYRFALKCFQSCGCLHLGHSFTESIPEVRGSPWPRVVRQRAPSTVSYTLTSLSHGRAYWVEILGREDENRLGHLEASVARGTIFVETRNVDAYRLYLRSAPVDLAAPVAIVENGQDLGTTADAVFVHRADRYDGAAQVKNGVLHGPVWDAFRDSYVVVWGRGGGNDISEASEQAARSLAGSGPCYVDADLPEELVETHNLILVGTPESNRWLAKVDRDMPVRATRDGVNAGRKVYRGHDLGYVVIYPNPLNTERYVAVFSATSAQAMARLPAAYSQMVAVRPADAGVFQVADAGKIQWHLLEKLNTLWQWHESYDRPMVTVKRKHSVRQWQQWLARTLRRHLQVDVVAYDDPFLFEDAVPVGALTYRDLFNRLKNHWIVRIEIGGGDLKALVAAQLAAISKETAAPPVVDGVGLVKVSGLDGEKVLAVSELKDDRRYTAAIPEKCINGTRLGIALRDYEIVGHVYLVPTLAEYLRAHREIDIDAELDRCQFAVF